MTETTLETMERLLSEATQLEQDCETAFEAVKTHQGDAKYQAWERLELARSQVLNLRVSVAQLRARAK